MIKSLMARPIVAWSLHVLRELLSYPARFAARRRIAAQFMLPPMRASLHPGSVAGLIRVKNEDFWIELIVRTTCKVLDEIIVVDTGSSDRTLYILESLQAEGLPFQLFKHNEPPKRFNLISNLIIARVIHAEYIYLIDGDEIQLEPSLIRLREECATEAGSEYVWRMTSHHLFIHPKDFCRCTPMNCPEVRFRSGRVFHRAKIRMSEVHCNDGLEHVTGLPLGSWLDGHTRFLHDVFALHCPFSQRSTIKAWLGNVSINPHMADYRRRYICSESSYIKLPFFPKEVLECRYSEHNYYIPLVLQNKIPLI